MSSTDATTERIVAEVLRRLRQDDAPRSVEPLPEAGRWAMPQTVITLESLREIPAGTTSLLVRCRAVVTPAARDELKRRKIKVLTTADKVSTANRLLIGCSDGPTTGRDVAPAGVNVLLLDARCPVEIVQQFEQRLSGSADLAAIVTHRPAVALCLANRYPSLRAALATDARSVRDAVQTLGANVLVIDPRGRSAHHLRSLLVEFTVGGPRECPLKHPLLKG
jgi:hypothetical protein